APDRNILDRPDAEALPGFLEDAVAAADVRTVLLVQSFETSRHVDTVADHRVAHPLLGADIADQHCIAVEAGSDVERLVPPRYPAFVQQDHAPLNAQGGNAGAPGMVVEQRRRAPERHD